MLPSLHRDEDVRIPTNVPIVNMLLEEAINDVDKPKPISPISNDTSHKIYEDVQPKPRKSEIVSCDAGTQTERVDKRGGCSVM